MTTKSTIPRVEKVVYPSWMSDEDVINTILKDIIRKNGRLTYTSVVRTETDSANNERIKVIIANMVREKLLMPVNSKQEELMLTVSGRLAADLGYKKYKRVKNRRNFNTKVGIFVSRYFFPIVIIICLALIYLFLHIIKVL